MHDTNINSKNVCVKDYTNTDTGTKNKQIGNVRIINER